MPLDAPLLERSRAALERWLELRAAYDAIDAALADPDQADLGALANRVVTLEHDLKPRIADLSAARSATASRSSARFQPSSRRSRRSKRQPRPADQSV